MDCQDYIKEFPERKKGQHLQREERGTIQHFKRQGYSNRAIAREIGCSPTTVGNELNRGTPPRKSNKGRRRDTQQSAVKRCTEAIAAVLISHTRLPGANLSPAGWISSSTSTSGLWIHVSAMPDCMDYSRRMKWSASTHFTMRFGLAHSP